MVERKAHTLKGQAASLRAEPFRQLVSQIEQSANRGDLDMVRDMLVGFEKEHEKLLKALEGIDWETL